MKRSATAVWQGSLKEGKGALSTASRTLKDVPYSFTSRFENGTGTNPEELIAAAHAGCFTMAFSHMLASAGFPPERVTTNATLTMEQVDGKWTISTIHLDVNAKVPGIDAPRLEETAKMAKADCPVSRVLKATVTMALTREP